MPARLDEIVVLWDMRMLLAELNWTLQRGIWNGTCWDSIFMKEVGSDSTLDRIESIVVF